MLHQGPTCENVYSRIEVGGTNLLVNTICLALSTPSSGTRILTKSQTSPNFHFVLACNRPIREPCCVRDSKGQQEVVFGRLNEDWCLPRLEEGQPASEEGDGEHDGSAVPARCYWRRHQDVIRHLLAVKGRVLSHACTMAFSFFIFWPFRACVTSL